MSDERNSQQDVIGEEYASSLADLTVNSKPLINMLTMLAEENAATAPVIVKVIEKHLSQVKPEMKLPVLYLIDSIVKNIGTAYTSLFTLNIVSTFCSVFEKVDEKTRAAMFKLRQTWSDVFPPKKLYALDVRVKSIDPAWPVTAPPPTSIHLNPAFLPSKEERVGYKPNPTRKVKSSSNQPSKTSKSAPVLETEAIAAPVVPASDLCEAEMRESLLKKQKELLELQQKKVEIELLQAKARLQQQQIQMIQTGQPDLIKGSLVVEEPKVEIPVQLPNTVPVPMDLDLDLDFDLPMQFIEELKPPPQLPVTVSPASLNMPSQDHLLMSPSSRSPDKRSPDKRSPDKRPEKKDKKDRDRDKEREPSRKKSRRDSEKDESSSSSRSKGKDKDRSRKGKEQTEVNVTTASTMEIAKPTKAADEDDDVMVVASKGVAPTMREAAKAMPRIPKINRNHPPGSGGGGTAPPKSASVQPAGGPNRDPRMLKPVQQQQGAGQHYSQLTKDGHTVQGTMVQPVGGGKNSGVASEEDVQLVGAFRGKGARSRAGSKRHPSPAADRRKNADTVKKEGAGDSKKRRTNRFDDLFGMEDIDLRKVPATAVPPAPGVVIPRPLASNRESPPPRGGWPAQSKRGVSRGRWGPAAPRGGRGAGGRVGPIPRDEEDREREQDGGGSPRNMDFILEQAKENHRNGVITDAEYSTVIRQVFQMSETKMIREVQRRESFPGPPAGHYPPHPQQHPHPPDQMIPGGPDFRGFPGPGPFDRQQQPERWDDPRRGGGGNFPPYPHGPPGPGRMQPRFDMPNQPPRGHLQGPMNAFEVRPDEDLKTIPIDNIPREIRFYGDQAIILMASDDPRLLGFAPCIRRVMLDNLPFDLTVGDDYVDLHFDGQIHQIKIGAPTRELYIDGKWYECMFGGPPTMLNFGGRPVAVALEGPPPTVKIGTERRFDLLAGRVTMIIDAHSVVPVYLDLKLQHFELGGQVFALQFKDALRTVVVDGHPYRVDFGGLPMPIMLDGRKHFVRFSSLPRGVEPGRVLIPFTPGGAPSVVAERLVEEEKGTISTPPPAGPLDIGELLSKLVATGLLPNAPEAPAKAPVKEEIKKEEPIKEVNLSDSESMKVRPNAVVSLLYSGMQCGSCGLRFPADQTVRYSTHLDWHFRQNRREKGAAKKPQSRKWYCSVVDWIQFEETETSDEKRLNWFEAQAREKSDKEGDRNGESASPEESTSVAVGSSPEENKCFVCREDLDQFFHEESEEWHLKDAVRMDGVTYHRLCYRDHLANLDAGAYDPSDALEDDDQKETENKIATEEEEFSTTETDEADLKTKIKIEPQESTAVEQQFPTVEQQFPTVEQQFPTDVSEPEIKVKSEPKDLAELDIQAEIKRELDELMNAKSEEESEPMESADAEAEPIASLQDTMPSAADNNTRTIDSDTAQLFGALISETSEMEEALSQPEIPVESCVFNQVKLEPVDSGELDYQQQLSTENEFQEEIALPDSISESMERETVAEHIDHTEERPVDTEQNQEEEGQQETPFSEEEMASQEEPFTPTKSTESAAEEENVDSNVAFTPFVASVLVENQTPSVITTLDGNVELSTKQVAQAAPSGIKIKINLFNKGPAAVSPTPPQSTQSVSSPPPPLPSTAAQLVADPVESVPSPLAPLTHIEKPAENALQQPNDPLLVPPPSPDEVALINKPRLIGRKLTVFPLTTKGVDASGLCSIM